MSEKLVIKEKYSRYWPTAAVVSFILSVVFFVLYHLIEDVLWIGYIRLASFSCFAVAILSFFKIYDGQVEISVSIIDDFIETVYKVRDKVIFETKHPTSDFYRLKTDLMPNKSMYNDFMKSDRCVRFQRKDESVWHYFNEIESRVIPLNKKNAGQLEDFLKKHSNSEAPDE